MCENSLSSIDEIVTVDNATGGPEEKYLNNNYLTNNGIVDRNGGSTSDIAFSKKAIHQCDADENLFLRFLELDPPLSDTQSNNSRRPSSVRPTLGRTPFTITKKLQKIGEKGFGFSIVWTHPPRIEKVENGLSAEKAGILPGDYVIFIDKYNIVTMPELDILNLIRTQGNTLVLEIFRRPARQGHDKKLNNNNPTRSQLSNAVIQQQSFEEDPLLKPARPWSSSAYSNASLELTKRRLQLPQVVASKESIAQQTPDSLRRRYLIQLINREQHFISAVNFGIERFVVALKDRKDLISANDHRTLFQNIDELLQISEDILEQLLQNDNDPQIHFASRVYLSKTTAICAAYKKYCNGLKRADCVLVNKSRTSNSEFISFISEPPIPKKRPDITTFIHRPLQHFREILKLIQMITANCPTESEEFKNFTNVISELQAAYREITVGGGLMEPIGEGRPLLSLQDLESRLVFTKCKPFTLAIPGRQWIFGGNLERIDGRSVKQYWTLLFSDILLFAKVSRDRVLFITDEPLPLSNVIDCCFNIRKKNNEFRLTIDPNGRTVESPTVHCAPDLTRTPLKSAKRRSIILRAPSNELKAVWQNLLTRQIFMMNTTLNGSSLNSPLESPDILNIQLGDMNALAHSMASIKLSSLESINNQRNQQIPIPNKTSNANASTTKSMKPGTSPKLNKHLEDLIDEKCNLLSKSGVSKEGTVHLAQWMKGQFNKQVCASEPIESDEEHSQLNDWSIEEVRKRSTELNLLEMKEKKDEGDTLNVSEQEDDGKSGSRSTTSDSQITVRSSPINNNNNTSRSDSISVCRQCHKFCKKKLQARALSPNDSNNNQVKVSTSKQKVSCSSESSTIVDESLGKESDKTSTNEFDSDKEKDKSDLRQSCTMNVIATETTETISIIKTSTSSPSSLHHHAKLQKQQTIKPNVRIKLESKSAHQIQQNTKEEVHKTSTSLNSLCNCECKPKDFEKTTLSPDEVKHEVVKILNDIEEISTNRETDFTDLKGVPESIYSHCNNPIAKKNAINRYKFLTNNDHMTTSNNNCNHVNMIKETMISSRSGSEEGPPEPAKKEVIVNGNGNKSNSDDELSLLIDLAQFPASSSLVKMSPTLPTISVVPPTPEPITVNKTSIFNPIKDLEITKINSISIKTESSFDSMDDSPQEEEPPYMALKTSLRRFGTMSSLERLPSEDTDDKTVNSSDEESETDLNIITRETFDNSQTFRTWTSRAGTFLEESRAFIDKYLGRHETTTITTEVTTTKINGTKELINDFDEYDTIEGETSGATSGATSGEEVWGTPTSGENDEMHMFSNVDGNRSSPTKSSSSYTGDEDTEIMMDELLMAPPMTNSNIRGLLPRRRLEPLFEEDTDSCDSNNENCLLNNDKQGEGIGKNTERCPSLRTSIDSDSPKTTPSSTNQTSLNGDEEQEELEEEESTLVKENWENGMKMEMLNNGAEDGDEEEEETQKTTTPVGQVVDCGNVADKCGVSALVSQTEKNASQNHTDNAVAIHTSAVPPQLRLSPRLEMRLALNHDIMSDEDLMNYDPAPDLTSILGRDLSSYHRMTGKDIIMNRIMNRHDIINNYSSNNNNSSNMKNDPMNSFCQQNNSKMDTPILNRKSSQRTWNNSGFARREEKALSDLERLARREKIYCMSQHHQQQLQMQQNSDSESVASNSSKKNKLLRFLSISRRNSETVYVKKVVSKDSFNSSDDTSSFQSERASSSHKESDKTLDRRFWKQLTKRRRSNSISEFPDDN